jgi:hypothetical protein
MLGIIFIGNSNTNIKIIQVDPNFENNIYNK